MEKIWYDLLDSFSDRSLEPKKNSRDSAIKKADEDIKNIERNKHLINTLPLWEPLIINIDTWARHLNSFRGCTCDLVVSIISFSNESCRCAVWSKEHDIYNSMSTKKTIKIMSLKFKTIRTWKPFTTEDAPFIISHFYIDDTFKKLLFRY